MKKIIFLVGLPCSGKSTYVKEHLKDCIVISYDDIGKLLAKMLNISYNDTFKLETTHIVKSIEKEMFAAAIELQAVLKKPIVFDNTHIGYYSIYQNIPDGYEIEVVKFSPNLNESKRRLIERNKKELLKEDPFDRHYVPEEVLERMYISWKSRDFIVNLGALSERVNKFTIID